VKRADQERGFVARDHALGHARAGRRRGLGVDVDGFDRSAEHPPLALNSLIAIIAPRRSSWPLAPYWPLASIVSRSSAVFLPGLRPGMVLLPRPEERRDAIQAGRCGGQCRDLQQAAPGWLLRVSSLISFPLCGSSSCAHGLQRATIWN
jgi:hypothetical protein